MSQAPNQPSLPVNHPSPSHQQPQQPPPASHPLLPGQQLSATVQDRHYGFSLAQPIQREAAPISCQVPAQNSSPLSLPLPPSITPDDQDISESESKNEASALQPEIDEQLDDEDDRQAHLLLYMALTSSMATPLQQSPAVIWQPSPMITQQSSPTVIQQLSPAVIQQSPTPCIDPSFVVRTQNISNSYLYVTQTFTGVQ